MKMHALHSSLIRFITVSALALGFIGCTTPVKKAEPTPTAPPPAKVANPQDDLNRNRVGYIKKVNIMIESEYARDLQNIGFVPGKLDEQLNQAWTTRGIINSTALQQLEVNITSLKLGAAGVLGRDSIKARVRQRSENGTELGQLYDFETTVAATGATTDARFNNLYREFIAQLTNRHLAMASR
jgi:hypothetical protein